MKKIINFSFKSEVISLFILVIVSLVSFYFYANFPDKVPTHWGINGEVDGWSSRALGAFLFPGIIIFTYLIFLFLPMLDPKKERYREFAAVYHLFKNLILSVLFLIYLLTGLFNLNLPINIAATVSLIIGMMILILGTQMKKIKSNWFIGIRTPWTLSCASVSGYW